MPGLFAATRVTPLLRPVITLTTATISVSPALRESRCNTAGKDKESNCCSGLDGFHLVHLALTECKPLANRQFPLKTITCRERFLAWVCFWVESSRCCGGSQPCGCLAGEPTRTTRSDGGYRGSNPLRSGPCESVAAGWPVILMRHAQAPGAIPPRDLANPVNNAPERQLEAVGRATPTAMGETFRELGSPVGIRPHKSHVSSKRAVPEPRHATPAQTAALAASGHGVHSGHEYAPRHPLAQRSNCLSRGQCGTEGGHGTRPGWQGT